MKINSNKIELILPNVSQVKEISTFHKKKSFSYQTSFENFLLNQNKLKYNVNRMMELSNVSSE